MAGTKKAWKARATLLEEALGYPAAWVDHPWGETVVKVNKKVFVFFGMDEDTGHEPGLGVKLAESHEQALANPSIEPSGYGLGKSGWVSIKLDAQSPSIDVLRDWIDESYRLVALQRNIKELDARDA